MRRYDDPVEVRRGPQDGPEQFLWHGRLWKVRAVLAHWVETGAWWNSSGISAVIGSSAGPDSGAEPTPVGDLLTERELWRVEAGRGGAGTGLGDTSGVFDLAFDWSDGCWQLVGCMD
jgi:hypothetical protein